MKGFAIDFMDATRHAKGWNRHLGNDLYFFIPQATFNILHLTIRKLKSRLWRYHFTLVYLLTMDGKYSNKHLIYYDNVIATFLFAQELFEFHHWGADWPSEESASCHRHFMYSRHSCLCLGQYFILHHIVTGRSAGLQCSSCYLRWKGVRLFRMDNSSVCRSIDVRCRQWYPIDVVASFLCRSVRRTNARDSNNDSNSTIHTDSCCIGHGIVVDGLLDGFRHFCIDQLRWICHLGKWWSAQFLNKPKLIVFSCALQLSIGVAVLCLPWLRWAQPNLPRPIRVPLVFPIVYLLATVFVTVVPMIASPVETGYGCLMILSSIPVYAVFVAWKSKPKWFQKTMCKYTTSQLTHFVWLLHKPTLWILKSQISLSCTEYRKMIHEMSVSLDLNNCHDV